MRCIVASDLLPVKPMSIGSRSTEKLTDFFSPDFTLVESFDEIHRTPWGSEQNFTWVVLNRSK